MMLIWGLAAAVPLAAVLGAFVTPRVVEYVETITIKGKPRNVYDAIRFQSRLMEWSAWPPETGSTCEVEGTDGALGARTVFMQKNGKRFGHQEVKALDTDSSVSLILESKGPPHKPKLHFYLAPIDADTTRVIFHFRNDIMPPFNLIQRIVGITSWTRDMHCKDLDGLKRYVERNETYRGEQAKAA
jgi:hypothetical protein